uniref:CKK domain-containing protein n=1 Tax=Brugia timori TaxID=42155 RepID=A0A0R3Q4X1_9BILA
LEIRKLVLSRNWNHKCLLYLHYMKDLTYVDDQTMKAMEREGAGRRSVTYKGHFQWPSKNSILTTPERKRSRRSMSFADSGLGSSIFGSPPSKSVTISDTAPMLKTPTRKRSPNTNSPSLQSPLKQVLVF